MIQIDLRTANDILLHILYSMRDMNQHGALLDVDGKRSISQIYLQSLAYI